MTALPRYAQRLWLLERPAGGQPPDAGAATPRSYAAGIALLDREAIYVAVIVSGEAGRADERGLRDFRDPQRLLRNAFRFATLDAALEGTGQLKTRFIARGWREGEDDGTSHPEMAHRNPAKRQPGAMDIDDGRELP